MAFTSSIQVGTPAAQAGPLLAVIASEEALAALPATLASGAGSQLAAAIASGDFKAKKDEAALFYPPGPATRLLLVGVGKAAEVTRQKLRRASAIIAKRARQLGTGSATVALAGGSAGGLTTKECYQVLAEGAAVGSWFFPDMKKPPEDPKPPLESITFLVDAGSEAEARTGHAIGAAIGAGGLVARGIQMLPPNVCTPSYLGRFAAELADRLGHRVTVLDQAAIVAEGMGALLAVAQGSAQEPRFVVLEYPGDAGAPVVLIGKGVTFDTGGISIKPADRMEDMKYDMSGAAAVLGTFEMLGRLRPKVNVIGLIPTVENMPSGTAYRPADVVKSHLGKTIEVVNTDAEGRLILADALSYARRFKPACVLDIATLTGAIGIALGQVAAGVMGEPPPLVQEVLAAGERAGERGWELPLWDEYRELIKSDIADMKNSGGRLGGSITAGWFLKEFVDGFPWVHLDIAATAYTDREDAASVRGPTAMGVRLFAEFVLARVSA